MPKTVYVLGAGFSKPAGFPLQREIYPLIIDRVFRSAATADSFVPLNISVEVAAFLVAAGLVDRKTKRPVFKLSMEDLFTLLDRIIQDRGIYCGYSWDKRTKVSASLTESDHQFRTLLRRALRSKTKITVVLPPANNAKKRSARNAVVNRYRQLFGRQQLHFSYAGVEGFIEKLVPARKTKDLLQKLTAYSAGPWTGSEAQ